MPTIRQFLHQSTNVGTQTSICGSDLQLSKSTLSKSVTPLTYKSTIAIRTDKSFNRLEQNKTINAAPYSTSNLKSPNVSKISNNTIASVRNNTVFMTNDSFESFFNKVSAENSLKNNYIEKFMQNQKKIDEKNSFFDVKIQEANNGNPFVVLDHNKPKIVPITPAKKKKKSGIRPFLNIKLRPYLQESTQNRSGNCYRELFSKDLDSIGVSIN